LFRGLAALFDWNEMLNNGRAKSILPRDRNVWRDRSHHGWNAPEIQPRSDNNREQAGKDSQLNPCETTSRFMEMRYTTGSDVMKGTQKRWFRNKKDLRDVLASLLPF
jgi:hypothetical protein